MSRHARIIALLLALALIFALGSACSNGGEQQSPDNSTPSSQEPSGDQPSGEPAESNEPSGEPVNDGSELLPITDEYYYYSMWMPVAPFAVQYGDDPENDWTIFREIRDRTNIRFEFQTVPAMDEVAGFSIFIAGQDFTDIICSVETLYTTKGQGAYEDEVIIDIKDLIYEYCPNLTQYFDMYPELKASVMSDEGQMFSFPQVNHPTGSEATGQAIRKDLLDKHNLDIPVTYDDYYNVLKVLAAEENSHLSILNSGCNYYMGLGLGINNVFRLTFNGYELPWYIAEDGKTVKCAFTEPEYREYIAMNQQWYAEGLIDKDYYSRENTPTQNAEHLVTEGYLAIFECNAASVSQWYTLADDPTFELAPLTFPVRNADDSKVSGFGDPTNGSSVRKLICGISTVCEDPVPFAKLINYMFSEQGYILGNYGVEGEGFEYVNGEPVFSDLVMNNPDGLPTVISMHLYAGGVGTLVPFAYDGTKTDSSYSEFQMEFVNSARSQYDYSRNYPNYATLTLEESEEYAKLAADMTTYLQEAINAIVLGTISMDEFDNVFLPRLQQMGLSRMVELKQAAYDRYLVRLNS